jgi:hypothetical protein
VTCSTFTFARYTVLPCIGRVSYLFVNAHQHRRPAPLSDEDALQTAAVNATRDWLESEGKANETVLVSPNGAVSMHKVYLVGCL